MQASKSHSSTSPHTAISSEGNPLISRPILHSSSKPPTTSNHPQQQQQTLSIGKKMSEQSIEDYQLDSFDDTDSESDVDYKPAAKVVNSTPSVLEKKLPGLSFSFDKPPFLAASEEKEKKTQAPGVNSSVVKGVVTSPDKPTSTVTNAPMAKETENLATKKAENVSAKKEDTSSNFDSSPPLSGAEDDHFKQFSSDSEDDDDDDDDDLPATTYIPSMSDGVTKHSHRNPLTSHPRQQITTANKEKDKILELAHSSFLEMGDTPKKNDSKMDTGSPSHNQETFSPITPLTDQANMPSILSSDTAKSTNKKVLEASATAGHASPLPGSDSSLNTESVIRQAEEIEQSVKNHPANADREVQSKTDLIPATTTRQEKSGEHQSEGDREDIYCIANECYFY